MYILHYIIIIIYIILQTKNLLARSSRYVSSLPLWTLLPPLDLLLSTH